MWIHIRIYTILSEVWKLKFKKSFYVLHKSYWFIKSHIQYSGFLILDTILTDYDQLLYTYNISIWELYRSFETSI